MSFSLPENAIRYTRDEDRELQSKAIILQLAGGKMDFRLLGGMLYLADRLSLVETGSTITLAPLFNTKQCPTVAISTSFVFDPEIRKFLDLAPPADIQLVKDPGDDELSDYDIETLTCTYNEYCNFSVDELQEALRQLPEWKTPFEAEEPILYETILKADGWSDDRIQQLRERLAAVQIFDKFRRSRH